VFNTLSHSGDPPTWLESFLSLIFTLPLRFWDNGVRLRRRTSRLMGMVVIPSPVYWSMKIHGSTYCSWWRDLLLVGEWVWCLIFTSLLSFSPWNWSWCCTERIIGATSATGTTRAREAAEKFKRELSYH